MKIGLTELHGIAQEYMQEPPEGVTYIPIKPQKNITEFIFTSTAKGVFKYFEDGHVDIIEAPIFPILTKQKWIYTPADFATGMNFSLFNLPMPKRFRYKFLEHLFKKNNFLKLIFKSEVGRKTLHNYAETIDDDFLSKICVIYPAVRKVDDRLIRFTEDKIRLLFVGDFLAKGGAHIVDAFEQLSFEFPNIRLRICSSDNFKTKNLRLEKRYKDKILNNKKITFGYVNREYLINQILPATDIFLCPTYKESYGYSIEEAMAFGIPVIATRIFAIPEIVTHEKSGFLINIEDFPFISVLKGYEVNNIPKNFHDYMTTKIYNYLRLLIKDKDLRIRMGMAGLKIARSKFSFERRNSLMAKIYEQGIKGG